MGHFDLSYQLRYTYQMNYWIRNWKWWWSYLLWGLGFKITNAYVIKKTLKFQHGIKKEDLISHQDIFKRIAIHWITSGDNNSSNASQSGTKWPLFYISKGGSTRRRISTAGLTSTSVSSLSMECEVVNPKTSRASTINNASLHHTSHLSK